MPRALPLVASLSSSCTGGHGLLSMPVADRPQPNTSGTEPLPPSRVQAGNPSPESGHTTPLFQPPGLQSCAVQAGAYQDQSSTLRVQGAQDTQSWTQGFVATVWLRTWVSLGVQRQTIADTTEGTSRFSYRRDKGTKT